MASASQGLGRFRRRGREGSSGKASSRLTLDPGAGPEAGAWLTSCARRKCLLENGDERTTTLTETPGGPELVSAFSLCERGRGRGASREWRRAAGGRFPWRDLASPAACESGSSSASAVEGGQTRWSLEKKQTVKSEIQFASLERLNMQKGTELGNFNDARNVRKSVNFTECVRRIQFGSRHF